MTGRMPLIATATIAILAVQGTVAAETVFQWTDPHGQPHFSDSPPPGQSTVLRGIAGDNRPPSPGGHGLRSGERRLLKRLAQQAEQQRRTRQSRGRKAHQYRVEKQQSCREMRERLRNTRDDALRKHYARELKQHCW
jgi:hypothetical protein